MAPHTPPWLATAPVNEVAVCEKTKCPLAWHSSHGPENRARLNTRSPLIVGAPAGPVVLWQAAKTSAVAIALKRLERSMCDLAQGGVFVDDKTNIRTSCLVWQFSVTAQRIGDDLRT